MTTSHFSANKAAPTRRSGRRGNQEGSITQLSDGRWQARVTLEGGRRKSYYGATRAEAAAKLTAALRDRDRGLPAISEKQTLGQYSSHWLEIKHTAVKVTTWVRYEELLRVHALPMLGTLPLEKITPQHLERLYLARITAGASPSTVRRVHTLLHHVFSDALRIGLLARNVSELVDPPRAPRHEMAFLTREQARALLAAASGHRLEALIVLALSTGMRQGELLGLRWRNVDLEARKVVVQQTVKYVSGQGYLFTDPKTKQSRRTVRLSTLAVEALQQHRTQQLEERLSVGPLWQDLDLVFPSKLGTPLDGGNVLSRVLHPLLRQAGLPIIRFHDLRHTAASLALAQGRNIKEVSELLGHADVAVTLSLYAHVSPDMQGQLADAMDAALRG